MFMAEAAIKLHDLENDTIKAALYGPNANLSPSTTAYTTSGEVSGGGYTAGGATVGMAVIGPTGSGIGDTGTFPTFTYPYANPEADTNIIVTGVAVRGLMLYNSSQSNRNIFVLDLGESVIPSGSLQLDWGPTGITLIEHTLIPLLGNVIS